MKKELAYLVFILLMTSCSDKKSDDPKQITEDVDKIEHRVNSMDKKIDSLSNTIK